MEIEEEKQATTTTTSSAPTQQFLLQFPIKRTRKKEKDYPILNDTQLHDIFILEAMKYYDLASNSPTGTSYEILEEYYFKSSSILEFLSIQYDFAPAAYALGVFYHNGLGLPKDMNRNFAKRKADTICRKAGPKALIFFENMTERNCQFFLGRIYDYGQYCDVKGTPKDYKKAIEYYQRAAEQGQPNAIYNIGFLYNNGFYT